MLRNIFIPDIKLRLGYTQRKVQTETYSTKKELGNFLRISVAFSFSLKIGLHTCEFSEHLTKMFALLNFVQKVVT